MEINRTVLVSLPGLAIGSRSVPSTVSSVVPENAIDVGAAETPDDHSLVTDLPLATRMIMSSWEMP
jgi:hypothetical protein